MTRSEAREAGLTRYYTGKPCKHNHFEERWTSNGHCLACDKQHQQAKRDANPEANRERVKAWQKANPKRHAKKTTTHFRYKKYGLTSEKVEQMLHVQQNLCAICKKPFPKTPNVDHCHKSRKVRGLLCNPCNQGLGLFKDDPISLTNAILYLQENQ